MFNGWIDPELKIDHIDGNKGNNHINNLRLVTNFYNSRNSSIKSNNKSGVTGVTLKSSKGYSCYSACWYGIDGKLKEKCFSILKLGEAEAFRLACEYRKQMIMELNAQGAGYTERHGI